jgi:hypothetical protein
MHAHHQKWILPILCTTAILLALLFHTAAARPGLENTSPDALVRSAGTIIPSDTNRLVYTETVPNSTQSTLWLASVPDLNQRILLATISHRLGYPPRGSVSPDGKLIAIFIIPPDANEIAARTNGGEIWLIHSDGSGLKRITTQAGFLAPWSRDSRWVSYGRLDPLTQAPDPQVLFRTEIWRVNIQDTSANLLLSDSQSYGIQPLGGSAADEQYHIARLSVDGQWTVLSVDPSTGAVLSTLPLPAAGLVRSLSLSPDGQQLLIESVLDGKDTLNLFNLAATGLQPQALPVLASAPMPDQNPVSPVAALWSSKSDHLWLYQAAQPGASPQARVLSAQNQSITVLQVQPLLSQSPAAVLLPASWSPDEQWFIWRQYPRQSSSIFLQSSGLGQLTPLPLEQPGNWIGLFGWVPAAAASQGAP